MGEIADDLINGDACEGCGEYFEEEGDGFPRRCGGCAGDEEKEERKQRIWAAIDHKITELKKRHVVQVFNDGYHFRFNTVLDIYPKNKRYHIVGNHPRKNDRGGYHDLVKFVDEFFGKNQDKPTEVPKTRNPIVSVREGSGYLMIYTPKHGWTQLEIVKPHGMRIEEFRDLMAVFHKRLIGENL